MPANVTISPSNALWVPKACNFFWVFLSATLEPLLGTMHSKPTNTYDKGGNPCNEARLTNYQQKPPAGHVQCFFPSGFRYFYQINNQGTIVPNSMIQVSGNRKPKLMCIGNHSYLEFINWQPQPNN